MNKVPFRVGQRFRHPETGFETEIVTVYESEYEGEPFWGGQHRVVHSGETEYLAGEGYAWHGEIVDGQPQFDPCLTELDQSSGVPPVMVEVTA